MENKEVINTLSEIRDMMEKSSRFLALSGLSVISVGIYALFTATIAYIFLIPVAGQHLHIEPFPPSSLYLLIALACTLLCISFLTVFLFSRTKARRNGRTLKPDPTACRLLRNFFIPLLAGGIFCLALLHRQDYEFIAPVMLIFYGLSLINGSKYSYSDIRYLGYAEVTLGLLNSFVPEYGLITWTLGFGIFHIIYGFYFYYRYDREKA